MKISKTLQNKKDQNSLRIKLVLDFHLGQLKFHSSFNISEL